MPIHPPEVLLELFGEAPALAPELLRRVFRIDVPAWDQVVQRPTDGAPGLVLVFSKNQVPQFGVLLQTHFDSPDIPFLWPHQAVTLRTELRAPVYLVAVTLWERLVPALSKPIALGHPGLQLTPLVVGPAQIPRIISRDEARQFAELAILSALAHGNSPGGLAVILAASAALVNQSDDHIRFYYDLMMGTFDDPVLRELDAMAREGQYQYQSEFAKRFLAEGQSQGRAGGELYATRKLFLRVVQQKGWSFTPEQQAQVEAADQSQLEAWFERIALVFTPADIFSKPKTPFK